MKKLLAGAASLALLWSPQGASAQALQMGAIVEADGNCPSGPVVSPGLGRPIYEESDGSLCTTATLTGTVDIGAITISNGSDVAQGSTTDAACATDNGTCTSIALLKRANQRLTSILTGPLPISAASLPLPTGAATSALQSAGNSTLSTSNAFLSTLASGVSGGVYQVNCVSGCSGGGGGGGAVTAVSGAYALGSIVDIGTGASPGANTVNGRLAALESSLGSPFQAGGSIGNTSFGISGTLPAFAATPTVNLGTIAGVSTAANQSTANGYLSTLAGAVSASKMNVVATQPTASLLNVTEASATAILAAVTGPIPAQSSTGVDIGAVETVAYTYKNIPTSTTTVIKSGAGMVHTVCINTDGTGASTAAVYDNTAGSGTKIATINSLAVTGCQLYDAAFATGLTVVTTGTAAPDVTVSFR